MKPNELRNLTEISFGRYWEFNSILRWYISRHWNLMEITSTTLWTWFVPQSMKRWESSETILCVSRRTSILSLLSISIINCTCRHYPGKILAELGGKKCSKAIAPNLWLRQLSVIARWTTLITAMQKILCNLLQKIWAVSLKVIFYTKLNVITVFPAFRTQPLAS